MGSIEISEELKKRTIQFASSIVKFFQQLPKTTEAQIIGKQLFRSSTSVASNYRAACRAQSDSEFYSKLCIVVEEADETLFWLELLIETGITKPENTNLYIKETTELLAIFASARKTLKKKLDK